MNPAQKYHTVAKARELMAAGHGLNATAKKLGIIPGTLSKWLRQESTPAKRKGRPPGVEFSEDAANLAKYYRLLKESLPVAVEFYAADDRVPIAIRRALIGMLDRCEAAGRDPDFPVSVRRAFAVSPEVRAKWEGRKAENALRLTRTRSMVIINADGVPENILPGEFWEMDDYDGNQPYCWYDREAGQWRLGRQILACRDLASAGWEGFDMIGRERNSYRGEDIVRFIGRMVKANGGLPKYLRLELGHWDSSFVHGLKVDGLAKPWGALDALMRIENVFTPQAKGALEGGFALLQRILSHNGVELGRHRGQYEAATKKWIAARKNGKNDPRELGFLTQAECLDLHIQAAKYLNAKSKRRKCYGQRLSADDLKSSEGWNVVPMPADQEWRFLPYKRMATVRGGVVTMVSGGGWPDIQFRVQGVHSGIPISSGMQLLVAYDPARPEAGAHIANGMPTNLAKNTEGWPLGMDLFQAPVMQATPQIDLRGARDTGHQKAATSAVSTQFAAIRTAAKATSIMDGKGNATTIRIGMEDLDLPEPGTVPDEAIPARDTAAPLPRNRRDTNLITGCSRPMSDAEMAAIEAELDRELLPAGIDPDEPIW